MDYKYETWVIKDLIALYYNEKLNLNPSYQRNDIWPPLSKKRLIDSIKRNYPLPTFFLYDKGDGLYDMIDGQQRTRTFIGYQKGFIKDSNKNLYNDEIDGRLYAEYKICICKVTIAENEQGAIEDFYYRVNKFGVKLNRPEVKKAEHAESPLQQLIEKLSKSESFTQLALFSSKSLERLNDLDFLSELLILINNGITDKKITVDKVYNSQEELNTESLEVTFNNIIQRICDLDEVYNISKTRYKQRNDFYTLFSYLLKHNDSLSDDLLVYQYKLLVLIDDDIYPTNERSWAFQEYATNCVSQSNSKRAREERLLFFEKLLLNKERSPVIASAPTEDEEIISDVIRYYSLELVPLRSIENYFLIDIESLLRSKPQIII